MTTEISQLLSIPPWRDSLTAEYRHKQTSTNQTTKAGAILATLEKTVFGEQQHPHMLPLNLFLPHNDPRLCKEYICRVDLILEGPLVWYYKYKLPLKVEEKFVWTWLVDTCMIWLLLFWLSRVHYTGVILLTKVGRSTMTLKQYIKTSALALLVIARCL